MSDELMNIVKDTLNIWATESFCWADQYVSILKFAPDYVFYSTTDVSGGMFNTRDDLN